MILGQPVQTRRVVAACIVIATTAVTLTATPQPQSDQPKPRVNADAAALREFQQRLDAYLKMRQAFSQKLEPLSSTEDSAELSARQESLAAALRTARNNAKPGDLIPAAVATLIKRTVAADLGRRKDGDKRAAFGEIPTGRPVINRTYPEQAALPTLPPLLLNQLPRLPDNLQYRFFDRHLLILDGDVQIIIDYVTNVLPPH